jgi:hypothetical protein
MAADLQFNLTGGASNSDPDASLGGVGSSAEITDPAEGNMFDSVLAREVVSSDLVEYRAMDIYNAGDATAVNVEFFITDTVSSESTLYTWYESSPGQSIDDELTEPAGATWTQPLLGSRLSLANLTAGSKHRIWVRRTVDQDASDISPDTATYNVWHT